jgi:hypothetical protein
MRHLDATISRVIGLARAIKGLRRAARWTLFLPLKPAGVAQW